MKPSITCLIGILSASASMAQAQSPSDKKLQSLTQRYEAVSQGKAVTDLQASMASLKQKYLLALTKTAESASGADRIEEAAALQGEAEALSQSAALPILAATAHPTLKKMRSIYAAELAKITAALDRTLGPAQRAYQRELQQLDADLSKKGLIDAATPVRAALATLGSEVGASIQLGRAGSKEQADAARAIAEWVLGNDGFVETDLGRIGPKEALTAIPSERFTVTHAFLRSKEGPIPWEKLRFLPEVDDFGFHQSDPPVSAEQMTHLKDLPILRKLTIDGKVESNALEQLPPLPTVKSLWRVTSSPLPWEQIRAKFPNLEVLNIMNEVLTDSSAAEIAQWTTMRDMETSGPLNEVIGQLFGAMPNLHRFSLHTGSHLEPSALRHFTRLKDFHTRNTDPGMLTTLADLPDIEKLHVGGLVPAEEMQALLGKRSLKDFGFVPSGDFGGTVGQLKITQHVPILVSCPALEYLELRGTDLNDEALMELTALKGLKRINVSRSLVTDAGAEAFRKRRPNCELIRKD